MIVCSVCGEQMDGLDFRVSDGLGGEKHSILAVCVANQLRGKTAEEARS